MDSIPANPSFILKIQSVASSVFGALFSRRHLAPTRQLEGTRQTTTSSSSPSAPQFRRVENPVNHQTHHYPSSSSEDNNLSKPASSLFRQLLICSAMATPYSFADNGPIPQGDPCSQLQSANVSKPIAPHRRAKRSQRERAARAVQQPNPSQEQSVHPVISTNDLSQQFKPRHEDGSVVKMDTMPSLAQRADQALLEYLDKRRITSHFLNEIDDFLTSYPELLKACPMWCYQLATLPPLDAYMFFIRGYLRPARYVDGALPSLDQLQIPDRPVYLEHSVFDAELFEFFADIGICYEILGDMDKEVALLTQDYLSGRQLNRHQLIFLAMVTYANPVDALKYYEYCYKTDFRQNRYVSYILSHLARFDPMPAPRPARPPPRSAPRAPKRSAPMNAPKGPRKAPNSARNFRNRRRPVRDQPDGLKASGVEIMRSFRKARNAMAKAADRGHDVIPVLIDCFADTVQRRSAQRPSRDELNRLCEVAYEVLEREYMTGGTRDIVELVMMLAPQARYGRAPSHFHPYVNNPTGAFYGIRSRYMRAAVNQVKTLYGKEAKTGSQPSHSLARDVKKAEYRLADLIGWYARLDGSMNKEEYEFLRTVFPHRMFEDAAEYDLINTGRLDVLLLLERWV
ncbi:hypothetical protein D6C91_06360 [Aureobasidium pullulans]|uniref:Uncharacterized protein n=1 Tax=Aureobasidium pullulans TaxID=5580 RepID=A0A4S9SX00_AURPU|nr:hypothetical protein D6C91_06360 [Aureobasidium pullulans]